MELAKLKALLGEVKDKLSKSTNADDSAVRVVSSGVFSCFRGYDLVIHKASVDTNSLGQISSIARKHNMLVKSVEDYLVICG